MNEVVFIKKHTSYRNGTSTTVKVYSKEQFIEGETEKDRNDILYCEIGKFSNPMQYMSLKTFREIFTSEEILLMMVNGVLDYNSKETSLHKKYPMFKMEIYKKYGVDMKNKEEK